MTVRTQLAQVKQVPPGTGVSYGHRYITSAQTTLGLIALGYYEGIPREATNKVPVLIRGRKLVISGTVCMNQCVVDGGELPIAAGDEVVLFGPGDRGEPTAQEWADLLGTISYDIVVRFTGKIPRSYSGVTSDVGDGRTRRGGVAASDASDPADMARAGRQEV
jgi:alanine racemase